MNLISGSLTRVAPRRADDVIGPLGHEPQHDAGHDDEHQQPAVEIGEDEAQRQHCAEVVDEAGGQNHLAQRRFTLPGFDHHGIDHGHGGGREGDAGDLGLVQGPAEHQLGKGPHAGKRQQEGRRADGQARPQVGPQRYRVNLRPGQERQHAAAQHGQEVRPVGRAQDLLAIAEVDIARGDADEDFDQRHRDADPNGNQAGDQRQPHPQRRYGPGVLEHRERSRVKRLLAGRREQPAPALTEINRVFHITIPTPPPSGDAGRSHQR